MEELIPYLIRYDSLGDGICCDNGFGNYQVTVANNVAVHGAQFAYEECTNFYARGCESDDECVRRLCEQGICQLGHCFYEVKPDTSSFVKIEIFTDEDPTETFWKLFDLEYSKEIPIELGGPYKAANQIVYSQIIELCADTPHLFCIYDTYGDGNCCEWGEGYYNLMVGADIIATGGEYEFYECVEFDSGSPVDISPTITPTASPSQPSPVPLSQPSIVPSALTTTPTTKRTPNPKPTNKPISTPKPTKKKKKKN